MATARQFVARTEDLVEAVGEYFVVERVEIVVRRCFQNKRLLKRAVLARKKQLLDVGRLYCERPQAHKGVAHHDSLIPREI